MQFSNNRKQLLDRIQGLASPDASLPIVTLEQFFVGNEFMESIIGESNTQFKPSVLFSIFKSLRSIDGI